jgi:hypothetical protein
MRCGYDMIYGENGRKAELMVLGYFSEKVTKSLRNRTLLIRHRKSYTYFYTLIFLIPNKALISTRTVFRDQAHNLKVVSSNLAPATRTSLDSNTLHRPRGAFRC